MKIQSDTESSPPHRTNVSDELGKPHVKTGVRRFRWRAVIRSGHSKLDPAGGQPTVAWHLADCALPDDADAHCEVGRRLLEVDGNPDGHCHIEGTCLRCEEAAAAAEAAQAAQAAAEQALAEAAAKANEADAAPPVEADTRPPGETDTSPPGEADAGQTGERGALSL